MITATQRTLKYLRGLGWECAIVEKWNPHAKIRQDLFGFIDIVALGMVNPTIGSETPVAYTAILRTIGVQSTVTAKHEEHRRKILANRILPIWLGSGSRVLLISWRKLMMTKKDGRRGKRAEWVPRLEWIQKEST